MNIIGQTIKTHDNKYVGKVLEMEKAPVGVMARFGQGIWFDEPYVAYAVRIDESPKGWSHLIARNDEEIVTKYLVA